MNKYFSIVMASIAMLFSSCLNGQTSKTLLDVIEFSKKVNETSNAQLIDVRTPGEFVKGHLQNAKNIDWNGDDFEKGISTIDKTKPVFVYCLSGGRSGAAASKMRENGFKEVYEMQGGIMKWRGAGLPETTTDAIAKQAGMTIAQFNELIASNPKVLIDFYADWCAPCQKMKPYLLEIANEMKDVKVVRINADDNQQLCKSLKVDALPVLQLYKNKTLVWNNNGFVPKETVVDQLKK